MIVVVLVAAEKVEDVEKDVGEEEDMEEVDMWTRKRSRTRKRMRSRMRTKKRPNLIFAMEGNTGCRW